MARFGTLEASLLFDLGEEVGVDVAGGAAVLAEEDIVGTQAMLNVKFGRWKNFAPAAMDIALGKYGRTPGPIDPEVLRLARERTKEEPMEGRAADRLAPRMDALRAELRAKGLPADDETAVLYAMFPQQVLDLLAGRKPSATPAPAPAGPAAKPATPAKRFRITLGAHRRDAIVEEVD